MEEPRSDALLGAEVPRLWTRPLRDLTPDTSLGFEVIEFAAVFLGIVLYPWQKWLLIHALELNLDGTFRFRRVIVLVARQNGKSTLAAVLAAWWLFVDADRFEERLPPFRFQVLGTAQNVDTAKDVWKTVAAWCDTDVDWHRPALARLTEKIVSGNNSPGVFLANGAEYIYRAASRKAGRGKSAARVLMDEMREQTTWDAWDSVSQTTKAVFNSQLWGISNAGDARSVVLWKQREARLLEIQEWLRRGVDELEAYANGSLQAPTSALFEWSAEDDCAIDDVAGILQANPSIGHGEITLESVLADAREVLNGSAPEASFRTEVLCQWVTADVKSYLNAAAWGDLADAESQIDPSSPACMAIDTSHDRERTHIAVAGWRADELAHVEVVATRGGVFWAPAAARTIADRFGIRRVVVQERGAPARDLIDELTRLGLEVIPIGGSDLGSATGQFHDRVRDKTVRHLGQPVADMAVTGGVTKRLADMEVWDRSASMVDVSPLVAESYALWGLEKGTGPVLVSAYEAVGGEQLGDWWEEA